MSDMKVKLLRHCTDDMTGKGYGPAIYPNESLEAAKRLIARGLAVEVTEDEDLGLADEDQVPLGQTESSDECVLPDDFPGRDKLVARGLLTLKEVKDLDDKDGLRTIPGVGNRTIAAIKERLGEL